MINVAFFIRHFSERGTEVSCFSYAQYNEEILKNRSYIVCFTEDKQREANLPPIRVSYGSFRSRFPILEIRDMADMAGIIEKYSIDFFYAQCFGAGSDIYQFDNRELWDNCKTIKHCVFDTTHPEGDFYISISETLNSKCKTNVPVVPYIVDQLPDCDCDLRKELGIPYDAVVIGRHGGETQFNLPIAHEAIAEFLATDERTYFLFLNTTPFLEHSRVIHLERNIDLQFKARFIDSCDAMIHARALGETFGLSVAEFSIRNRPVITCRCGDLEHIRILGDRAIQYSSKEELLDILNNIEGIKASRDDWNAYASFNPRSVMEIFDRTVFHKAD